MMAKKAEEADDVKKECPSCGLGVALDSKICEFCGWDFDEEDEWILQIEKLERDLLLEKQKFEPGSVEDKIESTLRSPFFQTEEEAAKAEKAAASSRTSPAKVQAKASMPAGPVVRETKASGVKVVKPIATTVEPEPVVRTTRPSTPAPVVEKPRAAPPVERAVPSAKGSASAPPQAAQKAPTQKTRKTRVVRKVKQA